MTFLKVNTHTYPEPLVVRAGSLSQVHNDGVLSSKAAMRAAQKESPARGHDAHHLSLTLVNAFALTHNPGRFILGKAKCRPSVRKGSVSERRRSPFACWPGFDPPTKHHRRRPVAIIYFAQDRSIVLHHCHVCPLFRNALSPRSDSLLTHILMNILCDDSRPSKLLFRMFTTRASKSWY